MKITSVIENTSNPGLPVEHGLTIADVDAAVISHRHYNHGGVPYRN